MKVARLCLALSALAIVPLAHADDHGDTLDTATRVALPSETDGAIDPGDDVDWFRFDVSARGETTLETAGSLDVEGILYDMLGNELVADDDSGSDLNFRLQRTLDAGTYYLRIAPHGGETGGYALRLASDASNNGAAATSATAAHLRTLGDFDGDVLLRKTDGRWYYYPMDGRHRTGRSGTVRMAA